MDDEVIDRVRLTIMMGRLKDTEAQPAPFLEDTGKVCVQDEVCKDLDRRDGGPLGLLRPYAGLIKDVEARKIMGIQKYHTPLQPFNGRDALVDLYQELIDAMQYAMQLILEDPEDQLVLKTAMMAYEDATLNAQAVKFILDRRS